MNQKTFSIKEAFAWGARTTLNNLLIVLALLLIGSFTLSLLMNFLPGLVVTKPKIVFNVSLFKPLGALVLSIISLVGLIKLPLIAYSNQRVTFKSTLIPDWRVYFFYILAYPLFSIVLLLGLLLLFLPGIYWYVRYGMYDIAIVDIECGPIAGLKKSKQLTSGAWWKLFAFYILSLVAGLFLSLTLIGIPFVLPFLRAARVHVYKQLQEQDQKPLTIPPVVS